MKTMPGVTLETIGGGVLAELFDLELTRILANIVDPNTVAEQKRTMTLKLSFSPGPKRDVSDVAITVEAKLASVRKVDAQLFLGRVHGQLVAVENDPRQSNLFDQPGPTTPVSVFPKKDVN
jgi:hypothetical protein